MQRSTGDPPSFLSPLFHLLLVHWKSLDLTVVFTFGLQHAEAAVEAHDLVPCLDPTQTLELARTALKAANAADRLSLDWQSQNAVSHRLL